MIHTYDIGMRFPALDAERIWTIAGTCECGNFISGEDIAWVSRVSVYCYDCA